MKTRLLILVIIFVIVLLMPSVTIPNVQALLCALPPLGTAFDNSDYVIHGKVIDKNYITWSLQKPIVTFEILESFKGNANEQISVSVNENWGYEFADGFEYVIFVKRTELSLEVDPCSPKFLALPSVVNIVRQVSLPDNEMRSSNSNIFYEKLTEQEKLEYESLNQLIQEKGTERWDSVTLQRQLSIIAFVLMISITGIAIFFIYRRRK
ncbi:MAG: hypothetical protein IIC67_00575 [Thaumarchaeota archaeon]|nr:hypothetical protein [Nitrososphaerota archaeon]